MKSLLLGSAQWNSDHRDLLEAHRLTKELRKESFEADQNSIPLPKIEYRGVQYLTCQLRYTKQVKRITLERALVSKIVYFPEEVNREDILIIYDNLLYIQDLASKDENFRKKFGQSLEVLSKILKGFRLTSKTSLGNVRKLSEQLREGLQGFYFPQRNARTELGKASKMFRITSFIPSGKLKKSLPPKAYIGKGYADSGTAKKPAYDASPSWQEVASADIDGEFK